MISRVKNLKISFPKIRSLFSNLKPSKTPTETIIGIDLGTTNSCVAVVQGQAPKVIENSEGMRTTPSIVGMTRDGVRLIGYPAKRQAITNPQNTVYASKRLIGRKYDDANVKKDIKHLSYKVTRASNGDAWVKLGNQNYSPSQIGAFVLMKMKQTAEIYLGKQCKSAVITVPAYFNDSQRQATKDAGKIAGLDVKRIINQPTAAALAYGLDKSENKTFAVFDLGGGTFDISILEMNDGVFEVKATNGDTSCGGQDLDAIVQTFFIDQFKKQSGIDLTNDKTALQRLREAAEKAKIQLSNQKSTQVNLPFLSSKNNQPVHFTYRLTQQKLDDMAQQFLKRTLKPCEVCLKDSGITKAKIQEVILVGGMTRMPKLQKMITNFFGKTPNKSINPDQAVAVGAAIQGGVLKGDVKDIMLLDVTPLSLGTKVVTGQFSKIILKNTSIPAKKSGIYTTVQDNQTSIQFQVLQGDNHIANLNKKLGSFVLQQIPQAPKGVPKIKVTFEIDANGLVYATALDLGTNKQKSIVVRTSGGLSTLEIEDMTQKAQKYRTSQKSKNNLIFLQSQAEELISKIMKILDCERSKLNETDIIKIQREMTNLKRIKGGGSTIQNYNKKLQEAVKSTKRVVDEMQKTLLSQVLRDWWDVAETLNINFKGKIAQIKFNIVLKFRVIIQLYCENYTIFYIENVQFECVYKLLQLLI